MTLRLSTLLLAVFAASTTLGDETSETISKQLQEAVAVTANAVAYFSSVEDPILKCLTSSLAAYEPDNLFAVFRYHYQAHDGEPRTDIDYCVNLTVTDTFTFGFRACEDGPDSSSVQMYYFNGLSCFVGTFPLLGNDYCLLWANQDFKDAVSEECVTGFDKNCGPERYILYDKEQCS
uniref:Putative lipocalin-5 1 n=1 Tax=Amblyomma triste TaxID=251400 RepID=A0A023G911_AMBTT